MLTFASLGRMLGLMTSRDDLTSMPESARAFLQSATTIAADYLGMAYTGGRNSILFDTHTDYRSAPGLTVPLFHRRTYPSFDLPSRGPAAALRVQYRGHYPWDHDAYFDWENVPDLVENEHYIYDAEFGRVRLLFQPGNYINGLRVSYGAEGQSVREVMVGDPLRQAVASTSVTGTNEAQLSRLFSGLPFKLAEESWSAPGAAELVMQPGGTLASITLRAPRDAPASASPLAVEVGGQTNGTMAVAETELAGTMPAGTYRIDVPEYVSGTTVVLRLTPSAPGAQAWSRMDLSMLHPTWRHLDGIVPEDISQATAMFAAHLYQVSMASKVEDGPGSPTMPAEVRALLRPYRRHNTGVTMI